MNKKIMMFFAIGVILMLGAGIVFAHQEKTTKLNQNDYFNMNRHMGYNMKEMHEDMNMQEMHEDMEKAFDTMDYDLWVKTMSENSHSGKVLDIITKDNFKIFTEAHNAMIDGDFDKSKELKQSIGLSMDQGMMSGSGNCEHN